MTPHYRVLIADQDSQVRRFLRNCVEKAGHEVSVEADSWGAFIASCGQGSPDLIIADIGLEGIETWDTTQRLNQAIATPLIIYTSIYTNASIERANDLGAFTYLLKPACDLSVQVSIEITMRRFQEWQHSRHEANDARQALQERKRIERAKGLIMQTQEMDEQAAHRYLQELARKRRESLINIADSILHPEQGPESRSLIAATSAGR